MVPSLRVGAPQRVSTGDQRSSALEASSCGLRVFVLWGNLLTSSSQTLWEALKHRTCCTVKVQN